ncbi:MAG: type II secretion system protein [Phycisphaerales bacterium]
MTRAIRDTGMTLIETLAALVILSLAVAAGGQWLVSFARFSSSMEHVSSDELATIRVAELIRDDVFMRAQDDSGRLLLLDDAGFELVTSNWVPGDPPGWNRVLWSFDDEDSWLVRTTRPVRDEGQPRERVVAQDVSEWSLNVFNEDEAAEGTAESVELSIAVGGATPRTVRIRLSDGGAR